MSTMARAERPSLDAAGTDVVPERRLVAASARWYSTLEEPGTTTADRRRTTGLVAAGSAASDEAGDTTTPDRCKTGSPEDVPAGRACAVAPSDANTVTRTVSSSF